MDTILSPSPAVTSLRSGTAKAFRVPCPFGCNGGGADVLVEDHHIDEQVRDFESRPRFCTVCGKAFRIGIQITLSGIKL